MKQSMLDTLANEILTLIEIEEARLLNWGFVHGRVDLEAQFSDILQNLPTATSEMWNKAGAEGITSVDILQNLRDRRLIFIGQEGRYRTRFAETIRLLYLLRQRFSPDDWQTANRLVSDMKLQLQRRRYPKRDIPCEQLLDDLQNQKNLSLTNLHIQTITRLLQDASGQIFSLARFQQEAIIQQFRNLQMRRDRALVIGAGTGAGKTKAFYIPALAHIADILANNEHTTKALAIYPRVELLKDQLAEAFSEAHKLSGILAARRKRSITIGAYYGDTPTSARDFFSRFPPSGWVQKRDKSGWICPYFTCPNDPKHNMVWEQTDLNKEKQANEHGNHGDYARLRCETCHLEVTQEQLLLTREQMIERPPDILFTTTEMLNRRLSRPREHKLFGIGVSKPPRLVLLDEIHTYEGLTGAQVAYLLRRWRYARRHHKYHSLCIVGLSATLTNATEFFAKLTNIPVYDVEYIFPQESDLIDEGIEYNLVLKSDPVSGTSLLSTSVQTAMLLGRVLDAPRNPVSRGAYGHKIFAFTDKLDVINRWYHIQYDAEKIMTLSKYRDVSSSDPTRRERYEMGQYWMICKLLGHELKSPLRLERTTSQDRGVEANTDLVIATSTLEVGFNDPTVGAVIQHKAPRSMASFLQRKGRAGRPRSMRPWTIVITSAYGRDRWAFQHAEMLFNPLLPPIELPIENYYVQKIQATYVLMDWLAWILRKNHPKIDLWRLLSNDQGQFRNTTAERQKIIALLQQLLDGSLTTDLETYLKGALALPDDKTVQTLMWGEPRPMLYEVIPTLLRQLETNWQITQAGKTKKWGDYLAKQPLPEFAPSTLFADLNMREVKLQIPKSQSKSSKYQTVHEEFLGLTQALSEFAPGKVSKRFASRYAIKEAHWLALPDDAQISRNALSLQYLNVDWDNIPKVIELNNEVYRVYRPLIYNLELVPKEVRSTSYAELIWRSHFEPKQSRFLRTEPIHGNLQTEVVTTGNILSLPKSSPWHRFFQTIEAFTQINGTWVDVTRMAVGVHTDTHYEKGKSRKRHLYFEDPSIIGQSAAIGFNLEVDGIKFSFNPLETETLLTTSAWPKLYRQFGPRYFLHKFRHDSRIVEAGLSSFEIEWLWQLELSMLLAVAVARQCSLSEAADEVKEKRQAMADRTLRVIFQSQKSEENDGQEETGRLHQKLLDFVAEPTITDALNDAITVLWQSNDRGLSRWLTANYAASLGATLFATVTRLIPDIEPDDLIMDVVDDAIWITEVTAGGVGLISKIADAIAQRPREFELQLLDTLQYCERGELAANLRNVTRLIDQGNSTLQNAFTKNRNQHDLLSLTQTHQMLAACLEDNGIPATREMIVALNTKFLRPNSDADTDALITTLVHHWETEQDRLGCNIDLRVMSVAARKIDEVETKIKQVLNRIGGNTTAVEENQVFNLLQSLLWLDCDDSCPNCIEKWHPYQNLGRPSRALLLTLLNLNHQQIKYGTNDWLKQLQQMLVQNYQAQLTCSQIELASCKQELLNYLVNPIDIGFQYFYPTVERIERHGTVYNIHLIIREMIGY